MKEATRQVRWRLVLLAVLAVPVVELITFVLVIRAIGPGWTLLATFATAVLGGFVLRAEGRRSLQRLREAARTGELPADRPSEGVLRLVSGFALVIPGFVTDLLGLFLLLPAVRRLVSQRLLRRFVERVSPDAANQIFGPRRVRARRGPSRPTDPQSHAPGAEPRPAAAQPPPDRPRSGEVIEGEVVE